MAYSAAPVQQKLFSYSAASTTLTPDSTIQAGNIVYACFGNASGSITVSTVKDQANNSFSLAKRQPGTGVTSEIWYLIAPVNITSVAVTFSSSTPGSAALLEYTGNPASSPLGVVSASGTGSSTSAAVGAMTPTAGSLVIGVIANATSGTKAAGSNYTIPTGLSNTNFAVVVRTSSTTSETAPCTLGTTSQWAEAAAEFLPGAVNTTSYAVNNANLFRSPYNHFISGSTYDLMLVQGAYYRLAFTGAASLAIAVDVSPLTGASVAAGNYPKIAWRAKDSSKSYNSPWSAVRQITSADSSITLLSGLTPANTYEVLVLQTWTSNSIDRWNTPLAGLKVTGFTLTSGVGGAAPTITAPTLRTNRMIAFGESTHANEGTGSDNDVRSSFLWMASKDLDAEIGIVAYSGQGVTGVVTGDLTNMVSLASAWPNYFSGQTRLSGGLLSPTPDYMYVGSGAGDAILSSPPSSGSFQTSYQSLLTAMMAARGAATKLFAFVPFSGAYRSAVVAAELAVGDGNTFSCDYGTDVDVYFDIVGSNATEATTEGRHIGAQYSGILAAKLTDKIRTAITPTGTSHASLSRGIG